MENVACDDRMTTDKTEPYVKDSMNDVEPPGPMKETCCSHCIETADETTENVDIFRILYSFVLVLSGVH